MKHDPIPGLERLRRCLPATAARAGPDTPLDTLGFDSLDTVEFLCAVHEEFGVRLTVDAFVPGQTLAELLNRITARCSELQPASIS